MQSKNNALPIGSPLQDGKYIIKEVLGQGGYGITYRGVAAGSRLHSVVAIKELFVLGSERVNGKVLHPTEHSDDSWARLTENFEREAFTIARLKHPSIITVYDCFAENDTLYLVMEFIAGETLDWLTRHRGGMLPEGDALRYTAEVADALSVLHANHVLHRDVKPANIMLNQQGRAVLIDFGNARDFVPDQTQSHTVILTPAFAPPEQFQTHARRGPFSDIYALAATCYWMLTGELLDNWDNSKVRNDPRLNPIVRLALSHALTFNPQERYQDAASFARELFIPATLPLDSLSPPAPAFQRNPMYTPSAHPAAPVITPPPPPAFQGNPMSTPPDRPLSPALPAIHPPRPPAPAQDNNMPRPLAPEPTWSEQASSWIAQHERLIVVAGSFISAVLVILIVAMLLISANNNPNQPVAAANTQPPLQAASPTALLARQSPTPMIGSRVATPARTPTPLSGGQAPLPASRPTPLKIATPVAQQWSATLLGGHTSPVNRASFNPDGNLMVTASADDTARIWDLQGKQLTVLSGHSNAVVSAVFSPDGKTVLTASLDKTARLWDLQGKQLVVFRGHTDGLTSVVFSPDGKTILTASADNTARLWDLQGNSLAVLTGHTDKVASAMFSPDGRRILTASWDQTARLWDLQGKSLAILNGHTARLQSAVFSPDGTKILTASDDSSARLWDLQGKSPAMFAGDTLPVLSAAFSPDNKYIVTAISR